MHIFLKYPFLISNNKEGKNTLYKKYIHILRSEIPSKNFKETLEKGAIPIGQSDKLGKSLRQFDEIQYENETYLIVWHPINNEFVGSHESGNWIPHTDLHKSLWIKNLKDSFVSKK